MKHVLKASALFVLLLITGLHALTAQHSNFKITYQMSAGGDEIDPLAASMMEGAQVIMYFKDKDFRHDSEMSAMRSSLRFDGVGKKGIILMDIMGLKIATEIENPGTEKGTSDVKIPAVRKTGRSRNIAGYTCDEYELTDGEGIRSLAWYTADILPESSQSGYQHPEIQGFPLEMNTMQDGMNVLLTAVSVETDKLDSKLFDIEVPNGYQHLSQEEIRSIGGQR